MSGAGRFSSVCSGFATGVPMRGKFFQPHTQHSSAPAIRAA